MTRGYKLPARFVLHTVGPVWRGGGHDEDALLAQCYGGSIELARTHGLGSIAFPGISTGRYGYPIARAAGVAVATAAGFRDQPGVPGDSSSAASPLPTSASMRTCWPRWRREAVAPALGRAGRAH